MFVFYFLAAVAIWLGILSLRGGLRFSSHVHGELARPAGNYQPFVSVIAPFRGREEGLAENIDALFAQNYPAYEIIFVTDRANDPGLAVVEDRRHAWQDVWHRPNKVLVAGPAVDCGQKVHNLRQAAGQIHESTEVIVFVDTDARPHPAWLRSLVYPLGDERAGAATGYRWFRPGKMSFASNLRSVWNAAIASALGADVEKNFCWGGSTAIRRTTFARLDIAERWRGSVSDDFTMTRVLQEAKLPIHFVPECLLLSPGDCGLRELVEFTNRQVKITRVYAPHLWKAILLGSSQFVLVFFGGIALVTVRILTGHPVALAGAILILIYLLGAAKGLIRLRAVQLAQHHYHLARQGMLAHLCLWPFASALFLVNSLAAAFSRRIEWRGISYELKSATEAVIIARDLEQNAK